MMPIHQAYVPILGAAAAEMLVGYLWYSDYAFGPLKRKVTGTTKKKTDISKEIAMHTIVAIVKATALFVLISMMQKACTTGYFQEGFGKIFSLFSYDTAKHNNTMMCALKTAGFVWLGFLLPARAACTIWGEKNWMKLLIVAGGQLAMTLAMAVAIAWLS